jgi:hypothetical protein
VRICAGQIFNFLQSYTYAAARLPKFSKQSKLESPAHAVFHFLVLVTKMDATTVVEIWILGFRHFC